MTGVQPRPLRRKPGPGTIRYRRGGETMVIDGRRYRFSLFPATLALRFEIWLFDAITRHGDGSGPSVDELLAHVTCDGEPVLSVPNEHADAVLKGLVSFNFQPFAKRKKKRRG